MRDSKGCKSSECYNQIFLKTREGILQKLKIRQAQIRNQYYVPYDNLDN